MSSQRDWIKTARTVIIDPSIEECVDPLDETYRLIQVLLASELVQDGDKFTAYTSLEIEDDAGILGQDAHLLVFHEYSDDVLYITAIIDFSKAIAAA